MTPRDWSRLATAGALVFVVTVLLLVTAGVVHAIASGGCP